MGESQGPDELPKSYYQQMAVQGDGIGLRTPCLRVEDLGSNRLHRNMAGVKNVYD